MAKTFEKVLDRVTVTPYQYTDSPETCYILEDTETGCVCFGTNGDPAYCDSREEAEAEGYFDDIELDVTYTLREFLEVERRYTPDEIEDDEEFLEYLNIGYGECDWLREMMA